MRCKGDLKRGIAPFSADHDEQIRAAIRSWRYTPFLVDRQAVAVCTPAIFIYLQSPPL